MEWGDHQRRVIEALGQLCANDSFLFEVDAHEQAITHKLGCYLSQQYPDIHVDCEYNRHGEDPKKLQLETDWLIKPDIIVHTRNTDEANEIVIEAKKVYNDDIERDVRKLKGLTSPHQDYRYDYGFHLTFSGGDDITFKVYRAGEEDGDLSGQIARAWANFINQFIRNIGLYGAVREY